MTAAARYLSFNETFTPACMGWATPGSEPDVGPTRITRKPESREMQLVYYVGVARGLSILVDFGKQRKVLSHVLSGILGHVPPLVSKYSLGYGRTMALFLLSDGYTFFAVADESLGRTKGFETLMQVRGAFMECMSGNMSASSTSSFTNSFETDVSTSTTGAGREARTPRGDGRHEERARFQSPQEELPALVQRPSMPRSRSASQLTALMSESMESRFERIVSKCVGRPGPRPKLEVYPDAPDAYLTHKKSVHEPEILEDPSVAGAEYGAASGGQSKLSARESLMSEIAQMLKEFETGTAAAAAAAQEESLASGERVRGRRRVGTEEEEDGEEEYIPGMHLMMKGMVGQGEKWFSIGGAAAWNTPTPTGKGGSAMMFKTTKFGAHREEQEEGTSEVSRPYLPPKAASGVLQPVAVFDDEEQGETPSAGRGRDLRIRVSRGMLTLGTDRRVAGRARERLGKGDSTDKGSPFVHHRAFGSTNGEDVDILEKGSPAGRRLFLRHGTGGSGKSFEGGPNFGASSPNLNGSSSRKMLKLRGALNSVFLRNASTRLHRATSLSKEDTKGIRGPIAMDMASVEEVSSANEEQAGVDTPRSVVSEAGNKFTPFLTSLRRRQEQEGEREREKERERPSSSRSWRLSASMHRSKPAHAPTGRNIPVVTNELDFGNETEL